MNVEFAAKFEKDIDGIQDASLKKQLLAVIEELELADNLQNIGNIKKLKGATYAYRIRMGDYRLGFFLEKRTCVLARFVHRKDIYNKFP